MIDAVVIRREPVADAPQNGVGPRRYTDLAIGRSDVRLHRVDTQIHHGRDLGVRLSLRDQREHLGFAIGETFGTSGPLKSGRGAGSLRRLADDDLPGGDRLDRGDEVSRGKVLER